MTLYTQTIKEARDTWAENLATALNVWFTQRHYSPDDKFGFRDKVGAKPRDWRRIVNGETIIGDEDVYYKLRQETGLTEADPTTIPKDDASEKLVRVRRNTMARSPDTVRKDPRLATISEKLKDWLGRNGYRTYNQLAQELGIKPAHLGMLIRAERYANPEVMARLFWRTDFPELDPRTIPPKKQQLPKSSEVMWIPRAWTDEEYQSWKDSWEREQSFAQSQPAEEVLTQDPVLPGPEEEISASTTGVVSPPLVGMETVGNLIDSYIAVFANQVGRHVADMVRKDVSTDFRQVAKDAVFDAVEAFTAPNSKPGKATVSSLSFEELIKEVTKRFEALKASSREDRDELVSKHASDLGNLYAAIVPFTMDGDSRERSLESERRHQ